jgi:hypothetical protein
MPRGIAWDELPNPYLKNRDPKTEKNEAQVQEPVAEKKEFNFSKDAPDIGKRALFGIIVSKLLVKVDDYSSDVFVSRWAV